MASIAHLAAGAVCGAAYARATSSKPSHAVAVFAVVALSPDLDFLALNFPEGSAGTPLEHRVMTHSLAFALVAGALLGGAMTSRGRRLHGVVWTVLALASHGVLDALTDNGPGPRLLWPFSRSPVQFAWHPLPGTEFFQEYFTPAAIPVVSAELLWSLPMLLLAWWIWAGPQPSGGRFLGSLGALLGRRTPAPEE